MKHFIDFGQYFKNSISKAKRDKIKANPSLKRLIDDYIFKNDEYQVNVDYESSTDPNCLIPDDSMEIIHLSIKRLDKQPIGENWYDILMEIKDQILGKEYEGIVLLPSREREHDMVNQYHIWVPVSKKTKKNGKYKYGWKVYHLLFQLVGIMVRQ